MASQSINGVCKCQFLRPLVASQTVNKRVTRFISTVHDSVSLCKISLCPVAMQELTISQLYLFVQNKDLSQRKATETGIIVRD